MTLPAFSQHTVAAGVFDEGHALPTLILALGILKKKKHSKQRLG